MSGQETIHLQGTWERAAWGLQVEQLPPRLPNLVLLAVQMRGGCGLAQEPRTLC